MSTMAMPIPIINSLVHRPSRASAAAIGHTYVLSDAPPALRVRALYAVSKIVCDWTVAILEEAINEPQKGYLARRCALDQLIDLVEQAIDRGYQGLGNAACAQLAQEAQSCLKSQANTGEHYEIGAVEDLCDHLGTAIERGVFPAVPDF